MPSSTRPELLDLPGATLLWFARFLPPAQAAAYLAALLTELDWQQRTVRMFGKEVAEPRLTAWHGDPGARYRYSGRDNIPQPWTPALLELRRLVIEATGAQYNSVLANLYRDGSDSMGWHADDEPELGAQPLIASVSLGAVRRMQFRPRPKGSIVLDLPLPDGSLLVMAGDTQTNYHHRIGRTARPVGPRMNLTFRLVAASVSP